MALWRRSTVMPRLPTLSSPQVHPDPRFSVRVRNTAAQATTTAVALTLSWNVTDTNRGLMFQLITPTQLVCRKPGVFEGVAEISWASDAVGYRRLDVIRINTDKTEDTVGGDIRAPAPATIRTVQNAPIHSEFRIGDKIEIRVTQTSGGALNVQSNSKDSPMLGLTLVRPLEPRVL